MSRGECKNRVKRRYKINQTTTILGIDFYSANSAVWEQADAHPPAFVLVGAVTGITPYMARYGGRTLTVDFAEARQRGIPRSAYGLYVEGIDPEAQAAALVNLVHEAGGADFPLALDLEIFGASLHPQAEHVRQWLLAVERLTGWKPIIYTSKPMWEQIAGSTAWAVDYDVWLAGYPLDSPGWHEPDTTYRVAIPEPWASAGKPWRFWQYAGNGIDLNVFNGGHEDWLAYLAGFQGERTVTILDSIKADGDLSKLPDNTATFIEVPLAQINGQGAFKVVKEFETTLGEVRGWGGSPVPIPPPVATESLMVNPVTVSDSLRVRSAPGLSGTVLAGLAPRTVVQVEAEYHPVIDSIQWRRLASGVNAGRYIGQKNINDGTVFLTNPQ